jgi:hypothetical protein
MSVMLTPVLLFKRDPRGAFDARSYWCYLSNSNSMVIHSSFMFSKISSLARYYCKKTAAQNTIKYLLKSKNMNRQN